MSCLGNYLGHSKRISILFEFLLSVIEPVFVFWLAIFLFCFNCLTFQNLTGLVQKDILYFFKKIVNSLFKTI